MNADLFPLLGGSPLVGRPFRPEEDNPGESYMDRDFLDASVYNGNRFAALRLRDS